MKEFFYPLGWLLFALVLSAPAAYGISSSKEDVHNTYKPKWPDKQESILMAASSQQLDPYPPAEGLFKEEKYDGVIELLAGPAQANPNDFKLNVLLAKAQLEKCAILKLKGDESYKTLVYQPYYIGRRLNKIDETRPEPYYIVAKSLLINNRASKAKRTIKKALYFSPNNSDYLLLLGDACYDIAESKKSGNAKGYFSQARDAYEKALEEKEELGIYVQKKFKQISEKLKTIKD